ncbi:unnamed protein product [marine sediment metagenome]|uniref:Amidohydrolase 3 domain-containing protein n=1 Tax=marine sediment metagenome TaxID=412755 RepID=X1M504_9ZZZZ
MEKLVELFYDLIISNGKIIDGTGNPWYSGDIAIVNKKIIKIGKLSKEKIEKIGLWGV